MSEDFIEYNVDCYARATVHAGSELEARMKAERGQYENLEVLEAEYVEKSDAQLLHEQEESRCTKE